MEYHHLIMLFSAIYVIAFCFLAGCSAGSNRRCDPSIEDYATIEAYVGEDEIPVYAFGYTYVWGQSPDLQPGAIAQQGNLNPITKIKLKKSWEIESNLCGSTPAREPKTMWNDDQPLLPIHLIDGDSETAWSSRGMLGPDVRPEWIRIDLPRESLVAAVALVCSKVGPARNAKWRVGKSLPGHLCVRASTDGKTWDTIYENVNFTGDDGGVNLLRFAPRQAKMIWVIGRNFEGKEVGCWGPSFSLGQLEVHDPNGVNLAAIARGAGVQVSSTHYGYGMDRYTQEMLWPIQYDLGFKWTRVGYDMGTFLWSYVEREKEQLRVDARADAAISEACQNGMNVILCLDKGNWLYHDPPRKVDWKKSRVQELMETYYDHQGWPHESDVLLEGYLRYVDYMVRHFKDRVAYFEICNEWQKGGFRTYYKLLSATLRTIKNAAPEAKVMLGSTSGFDRAMILRCLGASPGLEIRDGRLETLGLTLAFPQGVSVEDVVVSVDAAADASAGFVLRAASERDYLLAIYAPGDDIIYFREVKDGDWGEILDSSPVHGLGEEISLRVVVQGDTVTFTLSSEGKEFRADHRIVHCRLPGRVGLFHHVIPNVIVAQRYGNFRVEDAQGNVLFADDFNRVDGPAQGWVCADDDFVPSESLAPLVSAVGWHPFYQADPDSRSYRTYRAEVRQFKKDCTSLGFRGAYIASEWTWAAPYPGAPAWCTEMTKAKYAAQLMTTHASLDVISLYNETFQTGLINWDCTLLRNSSFQVDPITPTQPQPIYYVLRNISTILDGFRGVKLPVRLTAEREIECETFAKGEREFMVAAWIPGKTTDGIVETQADVVLGECKAEIVEVFDTMNGTTQAVQFAHDGTNTSVANLLIKDYPTFLWFRAVV